jgi:sugar lactone lactonase YvrE
MGRSGLSVPANRPSAKTLEETPMVNVPLLCWTLSALLSAALLAGCVYAGAPGTPASGLLSYPVKVEQAASGTQAALTLRVQAAELAAGYRTQYINVLDWELADATLSNADASIPTLSRTAAVSVDASLARSATLEFAPIKPMSGYTLTIALKRRDRAGVYQTIATGTQAAFALNAGANSATVTFSPTPSGQLQVSVPQTALPFVRPPVVEAIFPASASIGMLVDVSGANFGATPAANTVSFNGTAGTVVTASETALSALVPSGATSGLLAVGANGKFGTSAGSFPIVSSGTALATYGTGAGPQGMAIDGAGNMWICNNGGTSVSKLSPSGALLATHAAGTAPFAGAFDGAGNFWVVNYLSPGRVTRLSATGALLGTTTVGNTPVDIAFDGAGNAWVANYGDNTVSKLDSSGTLIGTYAIGVNPSQPGGLAIDAGGNVWVCNYTRGRVVKLSSAGAVLGSYYVGASPADLVMDGAGNFWVSLEGAAQVVQLLADGTTGTPFNVGGNPRAIALDPLGNLWVGNTSPSAQVVKVTTGGSVLGSYAVAGVPNAIAFDRNRAVWATLGSGQNAVRKLAL